MTRSRAVVKPVVLTVVASVAAFAMTILPWLRTGETRRSAFALARSADALGFVDTPLRRALVVTWYLLPFLTAATWTAAALGRHGVAAMLGAILGAMSVAAGAAVMAWLRPEPGPVGAVVAGGLALGGAAWLALSLRNETR